MRHLKARLLAVFLILLFAGLMYYNWRELLTEGKYHFKLATFGPVGVVGGFFLLLFPARAGKPQTAKDKLIVILVLVVGLAAGVLNLYLMDPGFFGKR
jgi:NhaP-type Na+/H+ or K+/H+ antiporter